MKNSTFGNYFLLVRGSCLISRLSSLLSVSVEKRATLPRAGAGARAGPGAGSAAGLTGAPGPHSGGQEGDRRSAPAVRPFCGWTGCPVQLWSADDEDGGDDDDDDEWPGGSSRHRALATVVFTAVRSRRSPAVRSLSPAAVPGAETDRPHGSARGSARPASLALHGRSRQRV